MNERPASTKHTSLVGLCLAAVPDVQAVSTQYPPESAPLGPRIIYSRKPHQNSEGFLIACQCTQQLGIGTKVFDSVQSPQAWVWFYNPVISGNGCFPLDSRITYFRHDRGFEGERGIFTISNQTAFLS